MKTIEEMLPIVMAATADSRLKWTKKDLTLSTRVGKYRIDVWEWSDHENDNNGFSVGIYEGDNQIDYITADQYSPRYSRVEDFYRMARRSAFNVGAIIDDIEKTILETPVPPKK
ncbi:hypothetical protein NMG46_20605 [Mesorhizobium sp. LMG 17147]|uniref:hypothetical protein n=1 Tax=Mesorhizobium sp. LMG 17147 TaxID=2963091 RepID=UPI0020C993AB|nr:hypothetical protein [Mesorhizobium sp. LMG 17147]MCP9232634.1 hypothetical protein [Mesorhizobium sp. LMG 17147]